MGCTPWAVILAGGDGQRVAELTRGTDGQPTPKQFWRLDGRTSMVRLALDRARRLAPEHQVLVVVNEAHRQHWEAELGDVARLNLLVQPSDRGTGAAILLGLLTVEARAGAQAPVLFLASDHLVGDEDTLEHGAKRALEGAASGAPGVFMLGLEGLAGSRDCGWILPVDARRTTFVYRFFEKPPSDTVRHLLDRDALVSAFIFAARVETLLNVVIETIPALAREFLAHRRTPGGVVDLMHLYDAIERTDFSRAIFQQAPHHLLVVRVPECGWVDLGTPDHLLAYVGRNTAARGVAAA